MQINELVQVKIKKGHGEFAGPCPFCGGDDRFLTWPEDGKTGKFWCRGCKKSGDGLKLIRELQGLTFPQAVDAFGLKPEDFPPTGRKKEKRVWTPKVKNGVPEEWSNSAEIFLEDCVFQLIKNREVRDYLHGRGLTPETIQAARLGWNPKDEFHTRTLWGLDPATDDQRKPKRTYLKAGIIIPKFKDGKIIGLKIRKANPDASGTYMHVGGSDASPMAWGTEKKTLVVVEAELCGLLLHQECGDLCGVIALGPCTTRPDAITEQTLRAAGVVLVALDSDGPGAREAWQWWLKHYPNAKRWPVPVGKDPTEAKQAGLDLRAWVMEGLPEEISKGQSDTLIEAEQEPTTGPGQSAPLTSPEPLQSTQTEKTYKDQGSDRRTVFEPFPDGWRARFNEEELERFAIMTVCGGLTDEAAYRSLRQ